MRVNDVLVTGLQRSRQYIYIHKALSAPRVENPTLPALVPLYAFIRVCISRYVPACLINKIIKLIAPYLRRKYYISVCIGALFFINLQCAFSYALYCYGFLAAKMHYLFFSFFEFFVVKQHCQSVPLSRDSRGSQAAILTSWLCTVYWIYLLVRFYVLVLFLSVLVIPTKLASSLVNF